MTAKIHTLTDGRSRPLRFILTGGEAGDCATALDLLAGLAPAGVIAYKLRNRIERFFNKLEHFRRIATRYDRRAIYFLAALHLASAMIGMR